MEIIMDEFLQTVPEYLHDLYRENWFTIRKSCKVGKLKDVYHFPVLPSDKITHKVDEVLNKYKNDIKINVRFGSAMIHRNTGEIKFSHPSNNPNVFDTAKLVSQCDPKDVQRIKDNIGWDDLIEIAHNSRDSPAWRVEAIVCIEFDVTKIYLTNVL